MNLPKLKGKILEMDKTYADCASALGISVTAFSNKINDKSKFYIDELEKLGDYLSMSSDERNTIFLN